MSRPTLIVVIVALVAVLVVVPLAGMAGMMVMGMWGGRTMAAWPDTMAGMGLGLIWLLLAIAALSALIVLAARTTTRS